MAENRQPRHFVRRIRVGSVERQKADDKRKTRKNEMQNRPLQRTLEERKPWKFTLGFKKLQQLKLENPTTILATLYGEQKALSCALNDPDLVKNMDLVFSLLYCLAQACKCTSAQLHVNELLNIFETSAFSQKFLIDYLSRILQVRPEEKSKYTQSINDLIDIFTQICIRTPSKMISILGGISFLESNLVHLNCDEDTSSKMDMLKQEKDSALKRWKEKNDHNTLHAERDEKDPPNDFRKISVFPTQDDLTTEPFLRRNKTRTAYSSVEQYLDVQFRLLREDFVGPLRQGILQYLMDKNLGKKTKIQDMRMYTNVRIISSVCKNDGICHQVSFDTYHLRKVRWELSKRLIFGSFVCLSSNRFKTLLFATVIDRNPKDLKEGFICLKFTEESQRYIEGTFESDKIYVMVETIAFFEAYKHVLVALQTFEDRIPFQDNIVFCDTGIKRPNYLRNKLNSIFDLRPLVDDDVILQNKNSRLPVEFSKKADIAKDVDIFGYWPSSELLHLDESQYKAVKNALMHEFVLTQGPPGTGKTYIGLKIVKALLHNKQLWSINSRTGEAENRPMLVVCYTNHALDQFMEGIMTFFKGNIIRVGGRCSNETVNRCNLKSQRYQMRMKKDFSAAVFRMKLQAKNRMVTIQNQMNKVSSLIESARKNILHEDELKDFIGKHWSDLQICNTDQSAILFWLQINVDFFYSNLNEEEKMTPPIEGHNEQNIEIEDNDIIEVVDEIDAIDNMRHLDLEEENDLEEMLGEIDFSIQNLSIAGGKIALNVSNLENDPQFILEDGWQMPKEYLRKHKYKIRHALMSRDRMTERETREIDNIWNLPIKDRWKLYRTWVHEYVMYLNSQIRGMGRTFQQACEQYKESLMQEDKEILQNASVIGMTTSGAARYQSVLQEIGPKIIVVEEAAEVLEAHVITTLNDNCEHLILIGDHKQLKPNPNVYKLAKEYNLDISLFERMINNDIDWDCLSCQHRMRPDISSYLKIIYPKLEDHFVVKNYENIKGISSNVFFLNHVFQESEEEESNSHSNVHEAEFIVALCSYLILQGYKTKQITILTLYSGQLFLMKKLMANAIFKGIKITVVDNFQGEENDIILLSLVRSNIKGKIGFLKIENRICVALSRAKFGLYVIGNLQLMKRESPLWEKILTKATEERHCGDFLPLYCQNHPKDGGLHAKMPKDFPPEGGCMKPCEFQLNCGHVCAMTCHVHDSGHKTYKCRKPCQKFHPDCNHKCKSLCYQKCGNCIEPIEKIIPPCGHIEVLPCSKKPVKEDCKHPCRITLPCGHQCKNLCGEDHTIVCAELIDHIYPCGHSGKVTCSKIEKAVCQEPCNTELECEHICKGTCGTCFKGRIHITCMQNCARNLICGHICPDKCSKCAPCKKLCENRCVHSRCQKACGALCIPCQEICEWSCPHLQCSKLCHEPCDRRPCNEPCNKRLKCKHKCIGLCGEKCPKLCRICDNDIVTEIFFGDEDEVNAKFVQLEDCEHVFEVNGLDTYMEMESTEKDQSIQLKRCPKCRTPIRRNLRYGNKIKSTLKKIEMVKTKLIGSIDEIQSFKCQLPIEIEKLNERGRISLMQEFEDLKNAEYCSEENYNTIKIKIDILEEIQNLQEKLERFTHRKSENICKDVSKYLQQMHSWCIQRRFYFTNQELKDINNELQRTAHMIDLLHCIHLVKHNLISIKEKLKSNIQWALKVLYDVQLYNGIRKQEVKRILKEIKEISKNAPGLGISEKERKEIVDAMGNNYFGHWFMCPKGHVYVIGDCGGATIESKCNECGASIGGQSHRLRHDNRMANFMDGAQRPAWPPVLD